MMTKSLVRNLSLPQREAMLEHIDHAIPIVNDDRHHIQTRNWLIANKYLKGSPANTIRPTHTVLTEVGREAVCIILGDYADALVAAGLLFLDADSDETALQTLRRLRSAKTMSTLTIVRNKPFFL